MISKYIEKDAPPGCHSCIHIEIEHFEMSSQISWISCNKPGREFMGNLKSFPFKKPPKCHDLDFWHSTFVPDTLKEEDIDAAVDAFHKARREEEQDADPEECSQNLGPEV